MNLPDSGKMVDYFSVFTINGRCAPGDGKDTVIASVLINLLQKVHVDSCGYPGVLCRRNNIVFLGFGAAVCGRKEIQKSGHAVRGQKDPYSGIRGLRIFSVLSADFHYFRKTALDEFQILRVFRLTALQLLEKSLRRKGSDAGFPGIGFFIRSNFGACVRRRRRRGCSGVFFFIF